MFLDDSFGCDKSFESTRDLYSVDKQAIVNVGFGPKSEQCVWAPLQLLPF